MSAVVRHVLDAIGEASVAHAEATRARLAAANAPMLERLGARLAAAQHGPPRGARRAVVVVAGDHGCADPGLSLGDGHPTAVAARAIADGSAAVVRLARPTPVVLVDAGAAERLPELAIRLGRGPTRDRTREPAMTVVDATLGRQARVALAISQAESTGGLDVLALGAIGLGAEVSAGALTAATTGRAIESDDALVALASRLGAEHHADAPLARLAAFGGPDTPVLAGLMLAAASINAAILVDGPATGAAALAATALQPALRGYLIPAHRGSGLRDPIFDVGLGHGEGTGAAMLLSLVDRVCALLEPTP